MLDSETRLALGAAENALGDLGEALHQLQAVFNHRPDLSSAWLHFLRPWEQCQAVLFKLIDDLENPGTREEDE